MIELEGVYRTYAMGGQLLHALNDVSESIEAGDYVAVVGPSGSGKSTLLNVWGVSIGRVRASTGWTVKMSDPSRKRISPRSGATRSGSFSRASS